jgi:Zn ribbon nucleic-acid-binding protein
MRCILEHVGALAVIVGATLACASACFGDAGRAPGKQHSVFFPRELVVRVRENARKYAWAREAQQRIVERAQPWMAFSDEQLWGLMFGDTITRSWMVWSNGHCPACKQSVPMYTWEMDALELPWKVRCPHCRQLFPKNDFLKFYQSGLDERGVFDPKRADRTLLFNSEHPDAHDPLHMFGVDDGEGYVEGDNRWRFIGAYLIYGQWKQAVLGGIRRLAEAYVVTGNPVYSHKAGILLDRVADLYPTFDFAREGLVYEQGGAAGYVSTWHGACEETRELALAYDHVFDALRQDWGLVAFLSEKARQCGLTNRKTTFADIQRNIEDGILRDAIANEHKIHSNYPRTDVAKLTIRTVLGWPGNRQDVYQALGEVIDRLTAVDGLTGEKGLAAYTAYAAQSAATLLGWYSRLDRDFLKEILRLHPQLHQTYRFHIDTWCLGKYYPQSGDSGSFAQPVEQYRGVSFSTSPGLEPSMYAFLWNLYELTGDAAFVQVLYGGNGSRVDGLPHDLSAADPDRFQKDVQKVVSQTGPSPRVGSVNKQQWHLAILRSGEGADARAVWLDYDSGGGHGHADGMNLGLFAKGLDLMPDLGYPPVNYGGWDSPKARWYSATASHNTVVVDGQNQLRAFPAPCAGKTTLWADGQTFRAVRASAPEIAGATQYERTAVMIDVSRRDFYVLDLFGVVGGTDHAKFIHSHFARIATNGLSLQPGAEYGHETQMRDFQSDPSPAQGWTADFKIEDRYGLLPPGSDVHLRCTDLTTGAQASTAEAWVALGGYNSSDSTWIPRALVRRQAAQAPLASTFVGLIEPYEKQPSIQHARCLALTAPGGSTYPDAAVAVEVSLADGRRDLLVAADARNMQGQSGGPNAVTMQKEWALRTDGELVFARRSTQGAIERLALCRGRSVSIGGNDLLMKSSAEHIEIVFENGVPTVVSGDAAQVQDIRINGRSVWRR